MADLQLHGLQKSFGDTRILSGIDLKVKDGEFIVFVGPSGCGKSTTLRAIAGLDDVDGGSIVIGGRNVTRLPPGDRRISMVFQSYALYPHMTVRRNLAFGLENDRLPKSDINARIEEAARILAIEALLDRKPGQLSGGQRQRVAIGRAIVRQPELFLFDEPLSNLDAALRVQTRGEISRLHKRLKSTMIYVTHDQIEAMTMADRIVVLNAGRIEQVGAPMELFDNPRNLFVAGFIGSPKMNFFKGRLVSASANMLELEAPGFGCLRLARTAGELAPGAELVLGLRPSHAELSSDGTGPVFLADYAETVGTETYVYGSIEGVADGEQVRLHLAGHVPIAEGARLNLHIDPQRLHVFDAESGLALAHADVTEDA